jgi:hypothetical protein
MICNMLRRERVRAPWMVDRTMSETKAEELVSPDVDVLEAESYMAGKCLARRTPSLEAHSTP